MNEDDVARAIACFEATDDLAFLREVLRAIRPKAEAAALQSARRGKAPPPPGTVVASASLASTGEAIATVRATKDFALLQAMARAAGRRVEQLAERGDDGV